VGSGAIPTTPGMFCVEHHERSIHRAASEWLCVSPVARRWARDQAAQGRRRARDQAAQGRRRQAPPRAAGAAVRGRPAALRAGAAARGNPAIDPHPVWFTPRIPIRVAVNAWNDRTALSSRRISRRASTRCRSAGGFPPPCSTPTRIPPHLRQSKMRLYQRRLSANLYAINYRIGMIDL
jgi:hypothetical protein